MEPMVEGQLLKIMHRSHREYELVFETGQGELVVRVDEGDRSIRNNIGDYEIFDEFKNV